MCAYAQVLPVRFRGGVVHGGTHKKHGRRQKFVGGRVHKCSPSAHTRGGLGACPLQENFGFQTSEIVFDVFWEYRARILQMYMLTARLALEAYTLASVAL